LKKEELHVLALQITQKDAEVRKMALQKGFSSIGATMSAIRDPSTACCSEIAELAALYLSLQKLQYSLVWEHQLDFDFVRKEYATILDPDPSQLSLCESLISKNMAFALEEDVSDIKIE